MVIVGVTLETSLTALRMNSLSKTTLRVLLGKDRCAGPRWFSTDCL